MSENVDIQKIKHLRGLTGAGIMDCRTALQEHDGDIERARQALQKDRQPAHHGPRERVAEEGRVALSQKPAQTTAAMVKLVCATPKGARHPDFQKLAHKMARATLAQTELAEGKILPGRALLQQNDELTHQLKTLRKKLDQRVELERIVWLQARPNHQLGAYLHADQTVGSLVEFQPEPDLREPGQLAHEMAMQVAALDPFQVSDMLKSSFIREPQMTVRRYLQEAGGAQIRQFFRFATKR